MIYTQKLSGGLIDTSNLEFARPDAVSIIHCSVKSAIFVMVSALVILFLAKVMKSKGFKFKQPLVITLGVIYSIILVIFGHGVGLYAIKGMFLFAVLMYASCSDLTNHEVDDCVWVIIIALAFVDMGSVTSMLLGAATVFVPMFIVAFVSKKSLGGADIKIMTALAFLLGFERGIAAMFIGLLSSVVVMSIYRKRHKESRSEPFALVPFLSAGALFLYLMCIP
ncbi:MAG: prepilin peptidase [Clostridia bacterium]|nr:prepilin peptidase [Clostridia bacterium]